jgi:WD40 repeat protein
MNPSFMPVGVRNHTILFIGLVLILSACAKTSPVDSPVPDRPTTTDNSVIFDPDPTSTRLDPTNTSTSQIQSNPVIVTENVENLVLVSQVTEPAMNSFAWLDQGRIVSLATDTQIAPYERFPLVPIEGLRTSYNYPAKLTVSDDGEKMAWIDADNIVYLGDIKHDSEVVELIERVSPITSLAFSPSGNELAIATIDGSVAMWNTVGSEMIVTWQYPSWYSNLSYSPDGNVLAGLDAQNYSINFIDVKNGEIQRVLEWTEGASPVLNGVYFSPDWDTIAWVARGTVQLMDRSSGDLGPVFHHEDAVNSVSWSPDSTLFASASAGTVAGVFSPVVYLWETDKGGKVNELVQPAIVIQIVFSPNGTEIGVLNYEDVLSFWAVSR